MQLERIVIDGQVYYKEVVDEVTGAPVEEEKGELLQKVKDGFQKACTTARNTVYALGKKITTTAEQWLSRGQTNKTTEDTQTLLRLLPFLDEEGRHGVFTEFEQHPHLLQGIDFGATLPFFQAEDRDALFLLLLEEGHRMDCFDAIKHVSPECLHRVTDEFLLGKYREFDISVLYPYLSKEDLRRLLDYYRKK